MFVHKNLGSNFHFSLHTLMFLLNVTLHNVSYSATRLFAHVPFRQAVCEYPEYANKRKHGDIQAHRPVV